MHNSRLCNLTSPHHYYSYELGNTHTHKYLCVNDLQMLGILPIICLIVGQSAILTSVRQYNAKLQRYTALCVQSFSTDDWPAIISANANTVKVSARSPTVGLDVRLRNLALQYGLLFWISSNPTCIVQCGFESLLGSKTSALM